MPEACISPTGDPDAWRYAELNVGDYLETAVRDTTHVRQSIVLLRLDKVDPRPRKGQWAEVSFLAVSS